MTQITGTVDGKRLIVLTRPYSILFRLGKTFLEVEGADFETVQMYIALCEMANTKEEQEHAAREAFLALEDFLVYRPKIKE